MKINTEMKRRLERDSEYLRKFRKKQKHEAYMKILIQAL